MSIRDDKLNYGKDVYVGLPAGAMMTYVPSSAITLNRTVRVACHCMRVDYIGRDLRIWKGSPFAFRMLVK